MRFSFLGFSADRIVGFIVCSEAVNSDSYENQKSEKCAKTHSCNACSGKALLFFGLANAVRITSPPSEGIRYLGTLSSRACHAVALGTVALVIEFVVVSNANECGAIEVAVIFGVASDVFAASCACCIAMLPGFAVGVRGAFGLS